MKSPEGMKRDGSAEVTRGGGPAPSGRAIPGAAPQAVGSGIMMLKQILQPKFTKAGEEAKWLKGKMSRGDLAMVMDYVITNISRLADGVAFNASQYDETLVKLEALLRELIERGHLDSGQYTNRVQIHQQFKQLLDDMNYGQSKNESWADKIEACRGWNAEHPDWTIRGVYVLGLSDHLRLTEAEGGLPLRERAEVAMDLGWDEEMFLSADEMAELVEQLKSEPINENEAFSDEEVTKLKEVTDADPEGDDGADDSADDGDTAK